MKQKLELIDNRNNTNTKTNTEITNTIEIWCKENIKGTWCSSTLYTKYWYFQGTEDAMAFKLRWL